MPPNCAFPQAFRQQPCLQAKEQAAREAREEAEREAKVQVEREAKEAAARAEQQRKDREERERLEKEAIAAHERAETEARERAERKASCIKKCNSAFDCGSDWYGLPLLCSGTCQSYPRYKSHVKQTGFAKMLTATCPV